MSYEQKRNALYGELEPMYRKSDSITNNNDCLTLFSNSDTPYFLLRYLLYPKKVYWITSEQYTYKCHYALIYQYPSKYISLINKMIPKKVKIAEFPNSKNAKQMSTMYYLN